MTTTEVPNITEGAVSGLDHESFTPRPSSGIRPRASIPAEGGVEALSKQAQDLDEQDASSAPVMSDGDDPTGFTVDQVNAHLASASDAERDRVLDAELNRDDGKEPRVTIHGLTVAE